MRRFHPNDYNWLRWPVMKACLKALAHLRFSEAEEALIFDAASRFDPQLKNHHLWKSRTVAEGLYEAVIRNGKTRWRSDAMNNMGTMALYAYQISRAEEWYQRLLEADPTYLPVYINLAEIQAYPRTEEGLKNALVYLEQAKAYTASWSERWPNDYSIRTLPFRISRFEEKLHELQQN
jgi:hypothetical protein